MLKRVIVDERGIALGEVGEVRKIGFWSIPVKIGVLLS
jgi:hypothetical protein